MIKIKLLIVMLLIGGIALLTFTLAFSFTNSQPVEVQPAKPVACPAPPLKCQTFPPNLEDTATVKEAKKALPRN